MKTNLVLYSLKNSAAGTRVVRALCPLMRLPWRALRTVRLWRRKLQPRMRHSEFAAACKNGSLTLSALAHTHIAVSPLHRSLLLSLTHAVSLTIARPASRAPLLKLPKQMAATVFTRFSWSSLRKASGARVSFERGERRDSQPRWCRRRSRRWTRWSARRVPPLLWSRSSTRAGAACRPRFESARSRGATEFLKHVSLLDLVMSASYIFFCDPCTTSMLLGNALLS